MSAFEDFVQTELPKRPYLNTDVSQETVVIRRGAGPRQLAAVTFAEGQVLVMIGGVLVAKTIQEILGSPSGSLLRSYVLNVTVAAGTWTITHNLNSENVIVQIFDENKFVMIPNSIQIIDANVVRVTFGTAATGIARVVFLD